MQILSEHRSAEGVVRYMQHDSHVIGLPMRFSLYMPPRAARQPVPLLVFLAGLTCTEETFMMKAGALRVASRLGLGLMAPDTSPRGAGVDGESDSWELGVGAGFYLDATQSPWARHWRMETYLLQELFPLVQEGWPIDRQRLGIFGHSMGGHGALTLALRNPGVFQSLSAFAPICAPMQAPWGQRAFSSYLGEDRSSWALHDACELIRSLKQPAYPQGILIDQGLNDKFLTDQLKPELLEAACSIVNQPLTLRRQPGYDHGYYFVSTFVDDHLVHHARTLCAGQGILRNGET